MGVEVRGVRFVLIAAAALGLAACSGTGAIRSSGDVVASAATKIDQAQEAYAGAKAFAELLIPFLPADRVERIREIESKIERLLWLARTAATIAEQISAVDQAEAAIAELGTT